MDFLSKKNVKDKSPQVLLTIAITTYNRLDLLKKLVKNIQDNIFNYNYEILIGNDYQGDFIDFEDENIIVYNHKTNLGEYQNICFLYEKSKGEYITFQFDDDLYSLKFFEKIYFFLNKKPDYIFSDFDFYYDNCHYSLYEDYKFHNYSGKEFKEKYFSRIHKTMGFTGVFKKDILANNGAIPKFTDNSFAIFSEYGLLLNIRDSNSVVFIDEKLVLNKIHDESFSVNENDFESFYVASKNLLNFLNIKKIEVLQKEIITNYFNRAILRTLIQKGKIKEFSKIFTLLDDKRKLKNFYLFCIFFLLKYFKKFLLLFFSFKKIHAIRHFFLLDKIFKSSF